MSKKTGGALACTTTSSVKNNPGNLLRRGDAPSPRGALAGTPEPRAVRRGPRRARPGRIDLLSRTKKTLEAYPTTSSVKNNPGNDLLSHGVAPEVPSAEEGLTTVFGMGTGVSPLL